MTQAVLAGVYPVLATPFHADGTPDEAGLRAITRYVIASGADGVVFPGVASEFDTLTPAERAPACKAPPRSWSWRRNRLATWRR